MQERGCRGLMTKGMIMAQNGIGELFRDFGQSLGEFFGGGRADPQRDMGLQVAFALLGYLAKLDSLVTSHEAEFINGAMDALKLTIRERELASEALQRGRNREIDLSEEFARFRTVYTPHSPESERLYDALIRLAAADERLRPKERQFLELATAELGYASEELDRRLAVIMPPR